jgi:cyclophilin family peptidyl-prolyl cis-trans isomerase/FKBP-type peptidyl-prolyl cis-trans isomerase
MKNITLKIAVALFLGVLCLQPLSAQSLQDGLYARMNTSRGRILIALEYRKTPLTVANFVGLAEGTIAFENRPPGKPFFDGLTFHRVIEDFMIQGGDPLENGTGGPGYRFPDEIAPELAHDGAGVLSMANSGPDTNGSQFFITRKPAPWLDGFHAVFGRVREGQEVVDAIRQGDRIDSVEILRIGAEARSFRVDQALFDRLLREAPERKKEYAARARRLALAEIERRWPEARVSDSGLRYVVLKPGSGQSHPEYGTTVTVHYSGQRLNGMVFDSSYQRGQPATFEIGRVIQGWNEALTGMRRAEKRILIVPPELAYGQRGYPGVIPPNEFLIFEVELLDF